MPQGFAALRRFSFWAVRKSIAELLPMMLDPKLHDLGSA